MLRIAKSYMRQAKARLEDAEDALEELNYPYTVRLSQECVELALKAVLKAIGIDYPKVHDVSDVFLRIEERLPSWFRADIPFLRESSKILVKKREISFYGGEEALLSPNDVICEEDAKDAATRARKVYNLCEKLIGELDKGF